MLRSPFAKVWVTAIPTGDTPDRWDHRIGRGWRWGQIADPLAQRIFDRDPERPLRYVPRWKAWLMEIFS